MVNSNVMRAVGEALESQNPDPRRDEPMADRIARALHISGSQAEEWLDALDQGATLEDANRIAGIETRRENEPVLIAIGRAIGNLAGALKTAPDKIA
ncbi:MAG TPA: hypothetical protein VG273_09765 [Bryobacteraceae bacterium]|jgi:hypothetical protein|nr:hypothetical protein [Bryobacteraceae bacterium]